MNEFPARGRGVRLAVDVMTGGAVRRNRAQRDDEVTDGKIELKPPARADTKEALAAERDQLLHPDGGRRAAHSGRLHRDSIPVIRAGEAEQPALGVDLHDVGEERLGDVLRAQRVPWEEARLRVVTRFRTQVD